MDDKHTLTPKSNFVSAEALFIAFLLINAINVSPGPRLRQGQPQGARNVIVKVTLSLALRYHK